jgi:hypothetical protein
MVGLINQISAEILTSLVRSLTGRLYTEEQIKSVTSGTLGKYFTEFFPTPEDEIEAHEK